jgi:hypothetical protein
MYNFKFFSITVVSVLWGYIPTEIHSTLSAEDEMLHYEYSQKISYEYLALVLHLLVEDDALNMVNRQNLKFLWI